MNTVRIYIDENLDQPKRSKLEKMIKGIPHVVDVKFGRNEIHEVVVDYDAHANIPVLLINTLRQQGFHPDIISA